MALRSKHWREKLKHNPEKYNLYKEKDAKRAKLYRLSLSEEKKERVRILTKKRVRNYREEKKKEKETQNPELSKSWTRNDELKKQERQKKWREDKRRQRQNLSSQKRKKINEKRQRKKQTLIVKLQTPTRKELGSRSNVDERSAEAKRTSLSRAKATLSKSPTKYVNTVIDLVQKSTPRERKAFEECCLFATSKKSGLFQDRALGAVKETLLKSSNTEEDRKRRIVGAFSVMRDNSHDTAVQSIQEAETITKAVDKTISKSKSAVLAALRNVHFAATLNLANVVVPQLNELCISQGVSQLLDLKVDKHTTYEHHSNIGEFQQSLAMVLEDQLIDKINNSGVFSILIDESTDVSVHQNLIVYVRILEKVLGRLEPRTYFLGLTQLGSATADSIREEVVFLLKDKCIDISKMVGIATDGASVTVGCRKGVVTQLREFCPGLVGVHCIAHRLALASGDAVDKVRYLVKFQEILNSIFKYFQYSPKNIARLEAVQSIVEGMNGTRMKEVFHTRWLSFEGAVQSIVSSFEGLVSVFLEEGSAKALSLLKPITTYKFLYTAHFLADCVKQLSMLCKAYQGSDIDFTVVNSLLQSTVDVLQKLRDSKCGENLVRFLNVSPEEPIVDQTGLSTFTFKGHSIRDSVSQRAEAVSSCEKFVDNVISYLKDRFTEKCDASVISALNVFFEPASCVVGLADGIVDDIVRYLGRCGLGSDTDCRQEVLGFRALSKARVNENRKAYGSSRDVVQLAIKNAPSFPSIAAAAERLLVIPVSTVDCERGFIKQNIIKTDLGNSHSPQSLETLLRISIHSGEIDYEKAYDNWVGVKYRRILKK